MPESQAGPAAPDCGQCWMLLVILNPSSALLLSLLSTSVVYLHCRNKATKDPRVYPTTPDSGSRTQDISFQNASPSS
ncbi:unnamed protein product [Gadus morhua 'NCC']